MMTLMMVMMTRTYATYLPHGDEDDGKDMHHQSVIGISGGKLVMMTMMMMIWRMQILMMTLMMMTVMTTIMMMILMMMTMKMMMMRRMYARYMHHHSIIGTYLGRETGDDDDDDGYND